MYKICPHCNVRNLDIAKYCVECEKPFSGTIRAVTTGKRAHKEFVPQITVVEDDELPGKYDDLEDDTNLRGAIRVEQIERPRGVQFGEVVGTARGGRHALGRRSGADRRSGRSILRQEGGNSERFRNGKGK